MTRRSKTCPPDPEVNTSLGSFASQKKENEMPEKNYHRFTGINCFLDGQSAPWIGTMDDPGSFLGESGWWASLSQAGEAEANHGRWLPPCPHNCYVTTQVMGQYWGKSSDGIPIPESVLMKR